MIHVVVSDRAARLLEGANNSTKGRTATHRPGVSQDVVIVPARTITVMHTICFCFSGVLLT